MRFLCSLGLHLWKWGKPQFGFVQTHYESVTVWMQRGTCERCGHEKWRRFP